MTATLTRTSAASAATLRRTAPFAVRYANLFLSPNNVRSKKQRSPEAIRRLASMIDADGLLSDLQVSAEFDAKGDATGRYGVEAGGIAFWRSAC